MCAQSGCSKAEIAAGEGGSGQGECGWEYVQLQELCGEVGKQAVSLSLSQELLSKYLRCWRQTQEGLDVSSVAPCKFKVTCRQVQCVSLGSSSSGLGPAAH